MGTSTVYILLRCYQQTDVRPSTSFGFATTFTAVRLRQKCCCCSKCLLNHVRSPPQRPALVSTSGRHRESSRVRHSGFGSGVSRCDHVKASSLCPRTVCAPLRPCAVVVVAILYIRRAIWSRALSRARLVSPRACGSRGASSAASASSARPYSSSPWGCAVP